MDPTILNHTVTFMRIFTCFEAIQVILYNGIYIKERNLKLRQGNRQQYAENNSGNSLWCL